MTPPELKEAFVISVTPWKVKIEVNTEIIENWSTVEKLKVGSYLKITDNDWIELIAIIENFNITLKDKKTINSEWVESIKEEKIYIIEAMPLWTIEDDKFIRWWNEVTIPPKWAFPAVKEDIEKIYNSWIDENAMFSFSKLVQDETIDVKVDWNKFFNKHFAIVGSTGSWKSHTLAKVLQTAINSKKEWLTDINNSHIVLFDIHWEYKTAFDTPNNINVKNLTLPYWLLNSDELEEFFLDTEANDHNQKNVFKEAIISNKKEKLEQIDWESDIDFLGRKEKIHYDSPLFFDIWEVLEISQNKNNEMVEGARVWTEKQWPLNWKLTNFVSRLENKISDNRLDFLLGQKSKDITFNNTLKQFLGYQDWELANITIIDLSWVPFDVLSITVSLISRLLFEYWYFYKRMQEWNSDKMDNPLLLVYEEAHKYVPKNWWAKFNSVKNSIERISKEWRKYWVTLWIVTQRPSEVSETIFSQCSNFVSMRLTNPDDQNYVKRLLPDSMWWLVDSLSTLKSWEAILMWDSVIMPSLVKIDKCEDELKPSSSDIDYLELWKENWKDLDFWNLEEEFKK